MGARRHTVGLLSLLTALLGACGPKRPAELVRDGRLFEACQLADDEYPEKSAPTRRAMRQQSDLRIEVELLDAAGAESLIGVSLPPQLAIMRYRYQRVEARVLSDIAVEKLRASGRRYEPWTLTNTAAVELLLGPDPRDLPDGYARDTLLMLLVFATIPLCVAGRCDFSQIERPAHREMARRHQERYRQVLSNPELNARRQRLMDLFGQQVARKVGPRLFEGYSLLRDSSKPAKRGERIHFVARHTVRGDGASCSLLDRFIVESDDLHATFASRPHLSELPIRDVTIWPRDGDHAGGWW